jgi:hypothetical protein
MRTQQLRLMAPMHEGSDPVRFKLEPGPFDTAHSWVLLGGCVITITVVQELRPLC